MDIADDPKLQNLNEKIQAEKDSAKLSELVDEFTRRLDEHDAKGPSSKPAQK